MSNISMGKNDWKEHLSHQITDKLGEGGMSVAHKPEDNHLTVLSHSTLLPPNLSIGQNDKKALQIRSESTGPLNQQNGL